MRSKSSHFCNTPNESIDSNCGQAISYCEETAEGAHGGMMWAGNYEYESQVNFCPICGQKARVQIDEPSQAEGTKQ